MSLAVLFLLQLQICGSHPDQPPAAQCDCGLQGDHLRRDAWVCTKSSLSLETQLVVVSKLTAISENHIVIGVGGDGSVMAWRWGVESLV